MEFVDGPSLLAVLKDKGPLDAPIAADFAYQVALGLQHAHTKGLIHRDLKPSNLLIGRDGRIKILDLGLARFLQDQIGDETITVAGAGLGTPDYMAPEQFGNARHADERSDVYALGCTLYHMLAGRVPFPGTSLSQKQRDHQQQEPEPLEHSAPNVPAGLAQTVYKMMAKKPAARFQTARECVEALMPYVAASSASLPDLSGTVNWEGSQFTIVTAGRRQRRRMKWSALVSLLVLLGTLLGFGLAQFGKTDASDADDLPDELIAADSRGDSAKTGAAKVSPGVKTPDAGKKPADKKASRPAAEPWLLTVAQDGSGQFRTINAALDVVKPGMTVRVLDGATYRERISLRSPSRHAGVTLEAVAGAKILNETAKGVTIAIQGVPDVTIRGFHLHATADKGMHIVLQKDCQGVVIEDVRLSAERWKGCNGAELYACNSRAGNFRPVIFQRCEFDGLKAGIIAVGGIGGYAPSRRLVIRNNVFREADVAGIQLVGSVTDALIAGNRFDRGSLFAVQLTHPSTGTDRVLIANNTFHENSAALRIDDKQVARGDIRLHNNLCLSPASRDFLFFHSNTLNADGSTPGDVKSLTKQWKFTHNWRETARPTTDDANAKAWVPPTPADVRTDKIEHLLSRDATSPDYLRPKSESPLAGQGAGQSDPALPSYVGAVPPRGTPAWDWDRTWRAPPGKHAVLTVSKNPKDAAKYDTINAALKDAKPWDAIRVLDDATYQEAIQIESAIRHTGLTLETVRGATLVAPAGAAHLISLDSVPGVTLRGFRLQARWDRKDGELPPCLARVKNHCPGLLLERMVLQTHPQTTVPDQFVRGIELSHSSGSPLPADPMRIQDCRFQRLYRAIGINGLHDNYQDPVPLGQIIVRRNDLEDVFQGIAVRGAARRVQIVGNRIWGSGSYGLQLENLVGASDILIANNSVFDCKLALRLWDHQDLWNQQPRGHNIQVRNNLFLASRQVDMVFVDSGGNPTTPRGGGKGELVARAWRIDHNVREGKPATENAEFLQARILPSLDDLQPAPRADFSLDDKDLENFLRPKKDSPLATGGAGGDLPKYVGAVPPKGAKPWNWEVTWRSRAMRARHFKGNAKPITGKAE
jgi:hypothetical protein